MKRYIYALMCLGLLLPGKSLQAKENKDQLKADYYYSHLAYSEAIPFYEKLASENTAVPDASLYTKLGDCYRLTKNPSMAAQWYGKAVSSPGVTDQTRLHYAEMLMMLQRYEEAAEQLRQYQTGNPGSRRAANMLTGCGEAKKMLSEIPGGVYTLLPFNTDGSEFGPAIWQKQLVFTTDAVLGDAFRKDGWTGSPYYNIYAVNCSSRGQCGTEFEPLSGRINTKYHDGPPMFTRDGSRMYFTRTQQQQQFFSQSPVSDRTGTVRLQIMIAEDYDAVEKRYRKVEPFKYNNREYSTAHPALSPDGNILVFSSDMSGGEGGTDLYMSRRDGSGGWSQPVNLGKGINTEGDEMFPVFVNGNTLSFSSNGHVGLGGLDVYYSSWNNQTQSWGDPEHAGTPVNSSYDDMSLTLYEDGKNGYFASNRPAAKKGDNVYHLFKQKVNLNLKVVDSFSGKEINGAIVGLQSVQDKRSLLTDWNGGVVTGMFPQSRYEVVVTKQGYKPYTASISTMNLPGEEETIERVIQLVPEMHITYNAVILDEVTRQPIENPVVVLTRDGSSAADSAQLSTGEHYIKTLEPGSMYHVYAVKEYYYSNEKLISTQDIAPEGPPINIGDTIYMRKLKIGDIYKIDNIYYDYDKANIREDAKPSLNRLLSLLQQYPGMTIQLNSHTDCRGANGYNQNLSNARAKSVVTYLMQQGISSRRMKSKGYGESKPVIRCAVCDECSEEQHQQNRRTEFQILKL